MTKIKNAKKGMAKKTLSMSLVVAMLATSNVPVWAAEFSDGTDAAFTSEVEAPVVEDNTADATEAQTAGDAWTVKLDKDLPTSVAWGNTDNVTGTIKQAGVDATSVSGLKYTWKDVATGLATDAGTDLTVGTDGKFTISLPTAKECVGNSYALFMWDNNGDWKYTSSAVSVVAKNIKDAGATVSLKADAKTGYTGKEVKAAVDVTMPSDFETTGKYSVDYTGAPDLINKGSKVTVTVTVTDSKLYTGSVTTEYTIGQKAATTEDFKLTYINNSYEYTGMPIIPAKADIRVQDVNGKTIDGAVKSVTATTTATTEVGSYEANAEVDLSKFENYSGALTTKVDGKYNVVARDLSKCTVTVKAKSASVDNKAVTVTASDLTIKDAKGNVLPLTDNDITVTVPSNAVASGTYTVTIGPKSGTKNVTGSTTAALTLYAKDINDVVDSTCLDTVATAELNKAAYYTGSQITKDASKFVGHILKKGTTEYLDKNQYSVEFDTNVNAGTGYVLIVGKNTYAGSVAKIPFTIQKATIAANDIKVANVEYKEGDGKDYKPAVTITAKTADKKSWTLKEGTDYTVKYALVDTNEIDKTVKATITFSDNVKKNYDLPTTADYYGTIVGKTLTSANIKMEKTSYDYTGKAIVPEYKVYDGDKLLKEGTDYVVKNTIGGKDVGEATLVITGKGNYNSKIDATAKFTVAPISADKVTVTYKNAEYNGSAIQPKLDVIEVKLGNVDVKSQFKITGYGENINAGKEAGSLTLTPVKDNKNFTAGTTKKATFDIAQATLTGTIKVYNANGIELTGTQNFTYDGTEKTFAKVVFTPSVTGNMKVTSNDYEIKYVNNVTGGGTDGTYVVVIAKGNYKGTDKVVDVTTNPKSEVTNVAAKKEFKIESKLYFTEKEVTVTDAEYPGEGMTAEPTIVVRDGDKVLVKDKDYKVTLTSTGNKPGATGTYEIKGIGVYKDKVNETTQTSYKKGTWKVVKKNVANLDVKVDLNEKGETVLTVMNGNLKVDNKDFTVTLSEDKKTATVAATTGNQYYVGSKEVTVGGEVAKVGTPVINGVKVVGNKATVILSGEADGATGYDYVISKANDTTTARVDVTKNQVKTTGDFNYVQQGTYYAYCHAWRRNAEGKKVFGEWSNIYPFSVSAITPAQPVITSVKAKGTTVTVTYTKAANAEGYDVVLGSAAKKVNGEYRPVSYGKLVKKNIKGNVVTATFKNVKKGTYYAGLHAFNKTSEDGKKVFSQWSNVKKVTVK